MFVERRDDLAQPESRKRLRLRRLGRALRSPALAAELAHILNRPLRIDDPLHDAGTMCRESAVLIASVAARMGVPANICTGEFAVFGQMQDGRDGCLLFKTHAWVDIEGFGLCDFSPDFRPGAGPGWRNITARYLAGSKYFPHQTSEFGHYTRGRHEFDRLVADLTQATPHFRTVYLELERRPFDNFVFVGAVNYAQSPLMRELAASSTFDLNILAKAAIHLWLMVSGKRSSLRKMDQRAAWEAISAIDSRAAELFRQRLRYSA